MGLSVQIPLHIKTSPEAGQDNMVLPLRRGLDNALNQVRDEVLTPRGGYVKLSPQLPEFQWLDPSNAFDEDARKSYEKALLDTLQESLAAQSFDKIINAPEVMPSPPYERAQQDRFKDGRYRIHSYEGGPDEVDLDLEVEKAPQLTDVWWEWDGTDESLGTKVLYILATYYPDAKPDRIGMLSRVKTKGRAIHAIHIELEWKTETSFIYNSHAFAIAETLQFSSLEGIKRHSGKPDYTYTHRKHEVYNSKELLSKIITDYMYEGKGVSPEPATTDTPDQTKMRQVFQLLIDEFVADYGDSTARTTSILEGPNRSYMLVVPNSAFDNAKEWTLHGIYDVKEITPSDGEGLARKGEAEQGKDNKKERGSFWKDDEERENREGEARFYPVVNVSGKNLELNLGPFNEEPSVDELGDLGKPIARLIRKIAYRLEMPEGEYCGSFLLAAAQMIGARAAGVAEAVNQTRPSQNQPAKGGTGNLGSVNFNPEASPAVNFLRYIAGVCKLITRLSSLMIQTYRHPDVRPLLGGRFAGQPTKWYYLFILEQGPHMDQGVGALFIRACQINMLQLLRSSRIEIKKRYDNFGEYYPILEGLILTFVVKEATLTKMRDKILAAQAITGESVQAVVSYTYGTWREARQSLSTSYSDIILNFAKNAPDFSTQAIHDPEYIDGKWIIRDQNSRPWTLKELEDGINLRSSQAKDIDPFISQLTDIPKVVHTFENAPYLARSYIKQLLKEMLDSNADLQKDVINQPDYAFGMGRISENMPRRTVPGTKVEMQGIHLIAHQAIGDAFERDHWYGSGVDYIFDAVLAKAALLGGLEFTVVIVLSVVCPPVGIALGAGIAVVKTYYALDAIDEYKAFIMPDEILNKSALELDLFLAELELILSVIPEIGALGKGGIQIGKTVGKKGLARGAVRLTAQARNAILQSWLKQAKKGLAKEFMQTLATDQAMSAFLPVVMGPLIKMIDAEIRGETYIPAELTKAATKPPEALEKQPSVDDKQKMITDLEAELDVDSAESD